MAVLSEAVAAATATGVATSGPADLVVEADFACDRGAGPVVSIAAFADSSSAPKREWSDADGRTSEVAAVVGAGAVDAIVALTRCPPRASPIVPR